VAGTRLAVSRRVSCQSGRNDRAIDVLPLVFFFPHRNIVHNFVVTITMTSRPELKEEDESSFCKFFRNLPQKDGDTVRIFDRGDYYSAHGEDAKFIASTV
jgi:hypothetical protein